MQPKDHPRSSVQTSLFGGDDDTTSANPPDSLTGASLLSQLTFSWFNPIIALGRSRPLTETDLPITPEPERASGLYDMLSVRWERELERNPVAPSFARALILATLPTLGPAGLVAVLESAAQIAQAVSLGMLVTLLAREDASDALGQMLCWAAAVSVCSVVAVVSHQQFFFVAWRQGLRIRVATVGALFQKSLRLSMNSLGEVSMGHVVSLASSDVEKFQITSIMATFLWLAPLEGVATGVLILAIGLYAVGVSFVAGFALVLVLVPVQFAFSRRFGALRRELARHTDRRIKLTAQAISGARLMKVMGWEHALAGLIARSREAELRGVRRSCSLRAANESIFFVAPLLQGFATFSLHVALGNAVEPAMAVMTLALLNVVQLSFTKFFCLAVEYGAQSLVSARRIGRLMRLPEQGRLSPHGEVGGREAEAEAEGSVLCVPPLHCKWSTASGPTLSGVGLEAGPAEMVVVVGAVGSGKTSLLLALLGELPASASAEMGAADRLRPWEGAGRLAYAAQEAWVLSATLRENILLGAPLDEARYRAVLAATCLDDDIARLPHGDKTEVGERGVALSGGQRARIGLARLAYRADADTYVIDDPLSALDPRVGRCPAVTARTVDSQELVFERCICGLLGGKRRLLVTHQLHFLRNPEVGRVAVLSAGMLRAWGAYDEVRASGALASMRADDNAEAPVAAPAAAPAAAPLAGKEKEVLGGEEAQAVAATPDTLEVVGARPQEEGAPPSKNGEEPTKEQGGAADAAADDDEKATPAEPSLLIEKEERATGVVRTSTYQGWVRAAGAPLLALSVSLLVAAQLLSLLGSVFLPYWGTLPVDQQRRALRGAACEPLLMCMPWWLLLLLACALTLLRSEIHFRLAVGASRRIHEAALQRLLRAPILFFDANPLGRILNRFSKDVEFADSLLPTTALDVLVCGLLVLASVALCLVVSPWIAAVLLPLILYFVRLRASFLAASREIKRLDSVTRSPVFSAFAEALHGTATIRAFDGMAPLVQRRFHELHDTNSRAYFLFVSSARWLGFRLDAICSVLLIAGTFAAVAAKHAAGGVLGGGDNPGLIGAALVFLVRLAGLFQWFVRQTAEFENQMVSVERLLAYARLPQEPPLASDAPPPAAWPQRGALVLKDVSMRYRPGLAPALRGVSFAVAPGSLVGVCGRTGAGKSSLLAALFRLSEPHEGTIEIDGVDCATVGLHELRPRLALILQAPFLFAGSVADNLSPLGAHTEAELWEALERVQLRPLVTALEGGLQHQLADGGANLSVGERQLLCLARALLQQARLLLLDEATANVDSATDATIQRSVREHFADATVVMIAHRLLTIADVNQVLLLSEGRVVQSGEPSRLLREPPDTARVNFAAMVEDAGLGPEAFVPSRRL